MTTVGFRVQARSDGDPVRHASPLTIQTAPNEVHFGPYRGSNLDTVGVVIPPLEADSVAVVDSDAVLAFLSALSGFKRSPGSPRSLNDVSAFRNRSGIEAVLSTLLYLRLACRSIRSNHLPAPALPGAPRESANHRTAHAVQPMRCRLCFVFKNKGSMAEEEGFEPPSESPR